MNLLSNSLPGGIEEYFRNATDNDMSSPETQRASPYQGLIPYSEADAPFFFGREKETRLIIANLFGSPLTLLYGASGVGKSSVLRAGVAHQLRDREDLIVVVFNAWQGDAASDLKEAVAARLDLVDHAGWRKVVSLLGDRDVSLSEFLAISSAQLSRRLMIILDQFEEYFLYHPQDDEFAEEFPEMVTQTDAPVSFLISIREDFYAKLDRFEGSIPGLYDNYLRIEHLDRKAARVAIEEPIAKFNQLHARDGKLFSVEQDLIEAVLEQVETGQVILGETGRGMIEPSKVLRRAKGQIETPFLQLVMTRLWDEELAAQSRKLQLTTLRRLGGAETIVRTHLDQVMSSLVPNEQDTAAIIFRYLVTPSGTKIAYNTSDLAAIAEAKPAEVEKVMKKLSDGQVRVLRPLDSSTGLGEVRYEIFHDVLAPAILDWRTRRIRAKLLQQNLEQSLAALTEIDRETAARLLRSLITSGNTRNLMRLATLVSEAELPAEQVKSTLDQLSSRAIVRSETRGGAIWFEVSHDLLLDPVQKWLSEHVRLKITALGRRGIFLIAAYVVLLGMFLIYGLVQFWPSVAALDSVEPVTFFFKEILLSHDERFILLTLLAGALGGLLVASRFFLTHLGKQVVATKWIFHYTALPFSGAALAIMFFFVLRGGLMNPEAPSSAINPLASMAMAVLIGMSSGRTTIRLMEVFEALFKAPLSRSSQLQKDAG